MAFRFPLTQNPHDLAQGLRKVKALNGTVDENPVTKGSDTGFQELSCRYRDYFHSDRAAISSSLNPSMQPSSSVQFRLLSTSKRPYIISLDRKPPKIDVKPPPVEDTDREAKARQRMAQESAIEVSTIFLESQRVIPSKRNDRIAQHFRSDGPPTPIAILRTPTGTEPTFRPAVPITQVWEKPSPFETPSQLRKRKRHRRRPDFDRLSPSFFRPPIPTGYALGYENSRSVYRLDTSYVPDRTKKGTLADWEPLQGRAARKAYRCRKRRDKRSLR